MTILSWFANGSRGDNDAVVPPSECLEFIQTAARSNLR
jgi:hypothetical protein